MSGWKKGLALLAALMLSSGVGANPERWQLNMTPGVTTSAHDVYQLHMIIFLVCCVIGVIVFGAIFYSILKFRKSQGAVAEKWSHNTTAEIIWTVVPILILVVMAVPATKTLMRMADTGDAEMTVKITGYQWKWRYEYVGTDVSFISSLARESDAARRLGSGVDVATVSNYLLDVDKPLILPTDTKIRFVITADDVIHSWWVPVLGWKQDAIPGFINEAWTSIKDPGTYRGQCAELCGKDHGFMPIVVIAKPRAEFDAWLADQKSAKAPAAGTVAQSEPVPPITKS
ncbi:MAG: cytochrome c oxidase subunit II [Xanthomonadales bacterium]|nr:cytochrome c oxidase subunit II [Xanthomonadales bacterium]